MRGMVKHVYMCLHATSMLICHPLTKTLSSAFSWVYRDVAGCAGIFTGHAALELYCEVFEGEGALDRCVARGLSREHDFFPLVSSPHVGYLDATHHNYLLKELSFQNFLGLYLLRSTIEKSSPDIVLQNPLSIHNLVRTFGRPPFWSALAPFLNIFHTATFHSRG